LMTPFHIASYNIRINRRDIPLIVTAYTTRTRGG
jgi:hypothetical protein